MARTRRVAGESSAPALPNKCPRCGSTDLRIARRQGMERILAILTGKRKYRCVECKVAFRDNDSRTSAAKPSR